MLLEDLFINESVPTMTFDGNQEDKIGELKSLVKYLNKTN